MNVPGSRLRARDIRGFMACLCLAACVCGGGCAGMRSPSVSGGRAAVPDEPADGDEVFEQLHLLAKALVHIRRNYVDEDRVAYRDLMHAALRGLLQGLDPYSQFLDGEAYRELREDTAGEFGGIGITIGIRDNLLTVIAPIEDTPAFRAGILAGDKIVEIDGEKTDGMTLTESMRKLRGEKGSPLSLRVMRQDRRELLTFALTRDVIRVPSVRGARMLDEGIGYLRITQFNETTAQNLDADMAILKAGGMRALALDLRNNSGGLLNAAVQVCRRFLKAGAPIVSTRGRGNEMIGDPLRAVRKGAYTDFPLVILINGGSASAAEIVAASLRDNRRAILVGERTFGKGSVQSVLPLDAETAIRLTTARYFTPGERVIHAKGIEPDIAVPMPAEVWRLVQIRRLREENPEMARELEDEHEDARGAVDTQLERAVDLLKALLIFGAAATDAA